MRTPLIAANWKMHKTVAEALDFVKVAEPHLAAIHKVEVVVCPPFTSLYPLSQRLQGSAIRLGAQDVFWEERGAYTGEISPEMLQEAGSRYVIIGHSERRQVLGETDTVINKKVGNALGNQLRPILCVGETLEERRAGLAREVVQAQLKSDLKGIMVQGSDLVVAYEPVWAIGTGVNASPEDAQEMSAFIREQLSQLLGNGAAGAARILYGGSVKQANIRDFVRQPDVDGALVGGASLDAGSFITIVKYTEETVHD
ncbi:MAG: triose-phosphate isomerase [Syntrophomonadaceae bacterium]|nr:triose-phosphate isomerase [Syntrophomonadaceae bacterium]